MYSVRKRVINFFTSRSPWPRLLRRRSASNRLLGLRVRITLGAWMFFSCECCALYRYKSLRRAEFICVIECDQVQK